MWILNRLALCQLSVRNEIKLAIWSLMRTCAVAMSYSTVTVWNTKMSHSQANLGVGSRPTWVIWGLFHLRIFPVSSEKACNLALPLDTTSSIQSSGFHISRNTRNVSYRCSRGVLLPWSCLFDAPVFFTHADAVHLGSLYSCLLTVLTCALLLLRTSVLMERGRRLNIHWNCGKTDKWRTC